jgi:hypothetical protein
MSNQSAINYAGKLLKQIKDHSPESAYWVVSALANIRDADPQMSAAQVFKIVCEHLPEEAAEYRDYVKTS